MADILTLTEVRKAIYVDYDYDQEELQRYAASASSYIKNKTGFDFASEDVIEPLAKQCAILYIRQLHFGGDGYNKEHDYSLGITSMIVDLQVIASEK